MSKKKILTIISLLIVGVLTISAISYSIAGLGNGEEVLLKEEGDAPAASPAYKTAIDMIIENSYKDENNTLNIVEIVPVGYSGSDLKAYIENSVDNFKRWVIDENRSEGMNVMKPDTIRYDLVPVSDTTTLNDTQGSNILGGPSTLSEILNSADLIYLSSPSYTAFDNKMSEDIYDYLHTYASGRDKPLIMDYVKESDIGSLDNRNYDALLNEIQLNYIRYKTFPWGVGDSAETFFKNARGNYGKSHYLPYSEANRTYRVLVITEDPGNGPIEKELKDHYKDVKTRVYYGTQEPEDSLDIIAVKPSDVTEAQLSGAYDFIVLEDNVRSSLISPAIYTKLKALSETGRYIFYGTTKAVSSGSNTGYSASNNYLKLMSLLMTANGLSRQLNVMSVRPGFFTSLNNAGPAGKDSAKEIADLFNNSDYRGSKTSGESRKYRVLEIEPCYPIDLELAAKNPVQTTKYTQNSAGYTPLKGGYYTLPDQVLSGVTKDEVEEGTEYYAFQMSKAKIAQITGLSYADIEVEQMSVNELISSKEVLAETYDMIYIGGNSSAYVQSTLVNFGQGTDWTGQYQNDCLASFTNFDMYTHTGYLAAYQVSNGFGSIGSNSDTSVVVSGHDLTQIKMEELKDYVDAGLPTIIDRQVANAYDTSAGKENRLEQLKLHDIDPDSYMYQFLKYAKTKKDDEAVANISWGDVNGNPNDPDHDNVFVENTDTGKYGSTVARTDAGTPGVTLFDEDSKNALVNMYNASKVRPTLTITSAPSEYDQNDSTTVHSEAEFSVSASAKSGTSAGSYNFYLLVDENGDGVYDFNDGEVDPTSECKATASGSEATLSYALEEDFFGLVSWKVVAYDSTNATLCDAKTGAAFFKLDSESKKTCRILQIMPITNGYNYSDGHSLFFCTECEQACGLIDYNIAIKSHDKYRGTPGLNSNRGSDGSSGVVDGMYLGKHEHTFGIVKYDSTINVDDWEDNFADKLTIGPDGTLETGDFEFDLDIVSVDKFDEYCLEAAKRTSADAEGNAEIASDLEEDYLTQLESTALSNAASALEEELFKAVDLFEGVNDSYYRADAIRKGIGTADKPGLWIVKKQYYKFFTYFNNDSSDWSSNYDSINGQIGDLRAAYKAYVTERDKALDLKSQYKTYARQSGTANDWISENYDIVVLGFANEFGGRDLKPESCVQLKTYVDNGGSVLNTHDTMTRYNNTSLGSYNLTSTLLESFGMDRFHVIGIDDGSGDDDDSKGKAKVRITNQTIILDESKVEQNFTEYKLRLGGKEDWRPTVNVTNEFSRDVNIVVKSQYGNVQNIDSVTLGSDHKGMDYEDITVTINDIDTSYVPNPEGLTFALVNKNNKIVASGKTDKDGMLTFKLPQTLSGDGYAKASEVSLGAFDACNIEATVSMTANGIVLDNSTLKTEPLDENQDEARIKLNVSNYADLPPSASFTLTVGKETRTAALDTDGAMNFSIPITSFTSKGNYQDAIDAAGNSSSKYIRYICGKSYAFFTERIIKGDSYKYNSPIGISDQFVSFDSSSHPTSMYKYVQMSNEAFDHTNLELDGSSYEAKYGTRRASKVNQGGLTTYPFAVSDELLISGTHAQMFTLDIEDSEVNVWYTLGANFVSSTPDVSAQFARYDSGLFAASPHDGLNNYFLYSKGSVFYTGAGHERIVGVYKDNNDERKLFVNVIVNSVTKGTKRPKIKIYNVCPNAEHAKQNCDDEYVNPSDISGNKALSKQMNKVFYNSSIKMYQYNVEEDTEDIFPTFDFKVIAGSADLKEVQVFYDLDYGTGPGMNTSNDYAETYDDYVNNKVINHSKEQNHFMVYHFKDTNAKNVSELRQRLSNKLPQVKVQEKFLKNYNNYTYLVIRAKDTKNKVKYARIKINIIPHLFDLTDATVGYPNCKVEKSNGILDVTDRRKFNI